MQLIAFLIANLDLIYKIGLWAWFLLPLVIVPALFKLPAPYGRFSSQKWGILVNGKLGWFVQEIISPFLVNGTFLFMQRHGLGTYSSFSQLSWIQWLLLGMWNLHYFNRTFIYTYRAPSMKPSPIGVVSAAIFFNLVNGFINGYAIAKASRSDFNTYFVGIGLLVFLLGFFGNIKADETLMNLRKGRDPKGYYIPEGGLYQLISCPNYFCELCEWFGYAMTSSFHPAAVGFVLQTAANLVPRAVSTHKWYIDKFRDKYPKQRKAIIPYVF